MTKISDIFIVGGGINGVGVARDAAGRGLKVTLVEKDDLASHTSSASSKLIHGGLRYLEQYEFKLVKESLREREILLKSAPHLVRPIRFVLPHHQGLRPAFMLRVGLFIYDFLGGRELLPATEVLNLRSHKNGDPLQDTFTKGFEYSDCWVDDARLVVLAAKDAEKRGATILTRHEVLSAERSAGVWTITVQTPDGGTEEFKARSLVNAAGAWVDDIEEKSSPKPDSQKNIRMVKGSHIIVPKLYDGDQAYTFQGEDNRVVFALPYEDEYTLIGTTDVPFNTDANNVHISEEEKLYLCNIASDYFDQPVHPETIVWSYSGVRPLVDDGEANASKTTRDYVLELDTQEHAPLLSIYGGKITTFRHLAEEVLAKLKPSLKFTAGPWTKLARLPGSEKLNPNNLKVLNSKIRQKYNFLPEYLLERLTAAYGGNAQKILGNAESLNDLGQHFGIGLYEAELEYMRTEEWAQTGEDALWRRSKLGLHMNEHDIATVGKWFKTQAQMQE